MTREGMVAKLAEETGIMKKDIQRILDTLPGLIRSEVEETGSMRYSGLGTFSLVKRAARQGRNPRSGEPITIPAKMFVKFKPHSNFLQNLRKI
jgi:DNA-binding protein HU-beta